jgi:probable HAF family extracellular repeat protein
VLRRSFQVVLLAGSLSALAAEARASGLYDATPLTAPNGFEQPTVEGFDNSGRVLFWNQFAPAGDPTYSLYDPKDGSLTRMGGSDPASQKTAFTPQHMSGDGRQMIGWTGGTPVLSSGGQTTPLPDWGQAVNDSGQVVVVHNAMGTPVTSGIVTSGQETPLGLVPGYDSTWALAINNAGQAAGTASTNLHSAGTLVTQPVFWDGHQLIPLGTFGGQQGYVTGLNNQGDVIGRADSATQTLGFVSHDGGPLIPLNVPGNPAGGAVPTSINDQGQIVGHLLNGNAMAWIYENGTMTDLNSLLSPSAHLRLTDALAINNSGQIIAEGIADSSKWPQLFLLTPDGQPLPLSPDPLVQTTPEPGTLTLFGLVIAGVYAHRRRKSA